MLVFQRQGDSSMCVLGWMVKLVHHLTALVGGRERSHGVLREEWASCHRHHEQVPNSCPGFQCRSGDPSRLVTLAIETASAALMICIEHGSWSIVSQKDSLSTARKSRPGSHALGLRLGCEIYWMVVYPYASSLDSEYQEWSHVSSAVTRQAIELVESALNIRKGFNTIPAVAVNRECWGFGEPFLLRPWT